MEKRRKKGEIDIEKRLEILDAVLKAAEEKGLENDESYLTLRKIYEAHNDSKTNFNNKNKTERNFWKFGDKATSVSLWGGGSAAAVITGLILASNPGGWLIAGAIALVAGCTAIGFALGKRSDAEVIDDCMRDLYEKIKNEQNKRSSGVEQTDLGNG